MTAAPRVHVAMLLAGDRGLVRRHRRLAAPAVRKRRRPSPPTPPRRPAGAGRRPAAAEPRVPRRRRTRLAQRHGRPTPAARYVTDLAQEDFSVFEDGVEAGRHLLQQDQPADRAGADARHERQHGHEAADRPGGGDRLRAPAAAAGSRRDHRFRQPRHHRRAVHRQRDRARAGDSQDVGRRLDVALQRDLHRAEGSQEDRRAKRRGDSAPRDRGALGRRRHVEPAAVRRGARSGQALGDRDLRDRPSQRRRRPRARASRRPSSRCGSSRRKPAGARSSPIRCSISPRCTARFPTSCRASTPSATRRAIRAATAAGGASSSASTDVS